MPDTLDPALEELGSTVLALPVRFREALAQWMMTNSFATGHGDTFADLLTELTWQVAELRQRATPQAEIDRLREALTEIDAMAAAACAKARDASEWGISSAIDPIANVASGSLSQPITFAAWCDKLNAHHEHLRQTEKDFEGYGPGKLTDDTGVECWTSYYASGSTPEGALAEDRTYWGD